MVEGFQLLRVEGPYWWMRCPCGDEEVFFGPRGYDDYDFDAMLEAHIKQDIAEGRLNG